MNPTETNTLAIIINTIVVIVISLLGIWGYKKYKGKNIVKDTTNIDGKITQNGGDNIIDEVDNSNGTIIQK